ncbi:MAG: pantetheine-phosphate adenylyltransferase [Anaerovoracaceae bacterium]
MKKALYAGSFDPLTCGHFDIIRRAANLCDELVIGVIENQSKTTYFTAQERMKIIREAVSELGNVKVDCFSGLLAEYVNNNEFSFVIRGLRGNVDFDYEIQMAQMNARLYKEKVETIFLMTNPGLSFISSSMAKEVHSLGGSLEGLVPPMALIALDEKLKKK